MGQLGAGGQAGERVHSTRLAAHCQASLAETRRDETGPFFPPATYRQKVEPALPPFGSLFTEWEGGGRSQKSTRPSDLQAWRPSIGKF